MAFVALLVAFVALLVAIVALDASLVETVVLDVSFVALSADSLAFPFADHTAVDLFAPDAAKFGLGEAFLDQSWHNFGGNLVLVENLAPFETLVKLAGEYDVQQQVLVAVLVAEKTDSGIGVVDETLQQFVLRDQHCEQASH